MKLEISGTIQTVSEIKKTKNSSFREFLLLTEEKYPQTIKFTLRLNSFTEYLFDTLDHHINKQANVHFNIQGSEYNGKYYVQLNAWKVETRSEYYADEQERKGVKLPF
jgi:hypothetical protein